MNGWQNTNGTPIDMADFEFHDGSHAELGYPVVVLRDDQVDRIARRVAEILGGAS